jgi:hypothetical protein
MALQAATVVMVACVLSFFFACPKKKNEKEKAPSHLPRRRRGAPVLLDAAGALQTRYAQTVQIPFSAASPVLGCVTMGFLTARGQRPGLRLLGK